MDTSRKTIPKMCVCGKILEYTYQQHKSYAGSLCIRVEVRHDRDLVATILIGQPRPDMEGSDEKEILMCAKILKERIAQDLYTRNALCADVWLAA